MKQILSFISNLLLISALYLFVGCASVSIEPQKLNENITSINENFTIKGKFKLSFKDSKETGYFTIEKYKSTVSMTLGKNYLLPEKDFFLDLRENFQLVEFLDTEKNQIRLPNVPVQSFLELFLGINNFNDNNEELDINLEYEADFNHPSKVFISTKEFELIVLVKNLWKS
ncbi:hypothetical protein N9442_00865 [Gammaproteobacteria bacterium]|nr:hypothetical protein [Gammaproteobacteria bacterium]MDC0508721.1 hypothetical protein [Gammaproteobacteria bacterium]